MPATHPSRTLYRIDECPELMADGCAGDEHGNLVFLSVWARDTAVQEFLARLTLGRDAQGLDRFHVITDQGASVPLFVGNVSGNRAAFLPTSSLGGGRIEAGWPRSVASTAWG